MQQRVDYGKDVLSTRQYHYEKCWALLVDVIVNDKHLFSTRLMEIHENERDLKTGRFRNYTEISFENEIVIDIKNHSDGLTYPWFEKWINWIADNTQSCWNVKTYHEHLRHIHVHFSFENP